MDLIQQEIDLEKKGLEFDKDLTRIKKNAFIEEIKNGLGEEIKKNPTVIIVPKKTFGEKFNNIIKAIFTKF
jgi:hypothetical protein